MDAIRVFEWLIAAWLFVLGSVLGSFLNVCIYRIPQHERLRDQLRGIVSPPSRCLRCGNRILITDNVPLIGWLRLRGRCRFCKARISPRYPLIELLNGLLFVALYWAEVPGFDETPLDSSVYASLGPQMLDGWSFTAMAYWRYAYHLVLIECLLVASFIDLDHMIIPDAATLPGMLVGVIGGCALGSVFLVPVWFQNPTLAQYAPEWMQQFAGTMVPPPGGMVRDRLVIPAWTIAHPHLHGLAVSLSGLVVGGGIVWGVRILGAWILRREAMGFGDVILMALIGSFLGWQPVVIVFFLAPAFAMIVVAVRWLTHREREIPYGPYLSLATLALLFFWQPIWSIGEGFFSLGPWVPMILLGMGVLLAGCLVLLQVAKRLLGIPLHPEEEWVEEWTSADQLHHFAADKSDPSHGRWRAAMTWPGELAARGRVHEHRWRNGSTGGGSLRLPERYGDPP